MSTIIGIAPGKSGAIMFLRDNRVSAYPIPVMPTGKGKRTDYNIGRLVEILRLYPASEVDLVVIEKQQAYRDQGAVSNFTTGGGYYLLLGIVTSLVLPYLVVTPQQWQKAVGIVRGGDYDTKKQSIQIAQRLYPTVNLKRTERCKGPDDGISDALLLAHYGRGVIGR